jgi:hypothetical protein
MKVVAQAPDPGPALSSGAVVAVHERDAEAVAMTGHAVLGLPETGRVPPDLLARHADADRIVALLREGQDGLLREHLFHLDPPRVHLAAWPARLTRLSIDVAIAGARPALVDGVLTLPEGAQRLRDYLLSPRSRGLGSGWQALDRLMPLRPGTAVGILAFPKAGKSTFAAQLCCNLARAGRVAWHASWEETADEMMVRVAAHLLGKPRGEIRMEDADSLAALRLPLLISGAQELPADMAGFERLAKTAHRRFGLDLLIVDNLQYLCRQRDGSVEALGWASKRLRLLAAETNAVVAMILQPRKPDRGDDDPPTSQDARWTNDVLADVHTMVVLHRWMRKDAIHAGDPLEAEMLVRVERSRDSGGGDALLVLDAPTASLREASPDEYSKFVNKRF